MSRAGTSYLTSLGEELGRVGIRGGLRRRIVDEFADHLSCDPAAELGEPRALAAQFADGLGTSRARTAAVAAFAALALAGTLLVARLLSMGPFSRLNPSAAETLGILAAVAAAQTAFVSGGLGLVRALRLRHATTIPAAEARILSRRAGLGLLAGAVATLALPLRAAASPGSTGPGWISAATVAVALGSIALAVPAVVRSARIRPTAGGSPGNLLDDLGAARPLVSILTGGSPTRFAWVTAAGLAVVVTIAGLIGSDPYDGALRGLFEATAYLGGYGLLGRYIGLR